MATPQGPASISSPRQSWYCSFCGKAHDEVAKPIAGPTVFICNECVDLYQSICQGKPLEESTTRRISLFTAQTDLDTVDALAKEGPIVWQSDEDLPAELRELADNGPVFMPSYVTVNRREWDRLIALALLGRRSKL
jgi:hypothetical protein